MKKFFSNFDKLFIIFLYMQPILDVLAGIFLYNRINTTISSIIRLSFMILCIIYMLIYVKDKKNNIYILLSFGYFIAFILAILLIKGMPAISYEIKNLLTTYYFVFIFITLLNLYRKNKFNTKHLFIIYTIYLLFVLIPNIFNIGFNTYYESKKGNTGWFVSANSVGSILSITLPILLINIKKIKIEYILLLLLNIFVIFNIGTKTPVLAFILILFVNLIYFVITLIKKKNYKVLGIILIPLIILISSSFVILPKTTFYKNIIIHINYLEKKDNGHITTSHIVDHFIFSQRLTFEEKTRKAYNNSSLIEKIFGIGYIENYATDNVRIKTVEIDYCDVFYRHGIVGFILFFMPVIYVLKDIFKRIKYEGYKKLNICLSITLILLLALFQGHIFVTPATSVFVALILSLTYNNSFEYKNKLNN